MMSNKEILEKAIQKAIDGGWTGGKFFNWSGDWMGEVPKLEVTSPFPNIAWLKYKTGGVDVREETYPPSVMLFDHDFAKAFFGAHEIQVEYMEPAWQYHLQQMVIADDPIKYLGDNL